MGSPDRPSSPTDDSGSTLTSTGTSAGSTAVMSALEELPPGRWSIRRSLGVRRSLGIMRRRGSPAARRHASYDAPTSGVAERFVAELRARRAERLARERRQAQDGALVHNEAHGWDWLVVHPHSRRMALFDLLVFFCVSVTAVSLPLEVGFSIVATTPLRIVDVIMSTVFLIDVALQFVHGSMHRGYPELRLRRIARRYLRSYFVPDLLASLPYGLMGTSPALQAIGMVRVLRILRFRRLTHQLKKLPLLGAAMRSPFTRVAVTVLVWVYICHFYGCVWHLAGSLSLCLDEPLYPGGTWLTAYYSEDGGGTFVTKEALCARVRGEEEGELCPGEGCTPPTLGSLYVRSLYWALSSMSPMGYGDGPRAITDLEFALSIIVQVTGACCSAIIFSRVAQFINQRDAARLRYDCEKTAISEFASFQLLPPPMSARLHDYHAFHFAASRDYDVERVAGLLPPAFRGEIYLHLHEGLLRQVPIFHRADKRFILALAKALRPQVLLAGDYAFNARELGDAAYFIDKGVVELLSAEGSLADTLSPGGYFGEAALLGSKRRAGSARAASNCVLFSLSAGAFQAALGEHPEQRAVVERAIEAGRDHSAARRWNETLLMARQHSQHSDARRSSNRLRAEGRDDGGEESKDAPDAAT